MHVSADMDTPPKIQPTSPVNEVIERYPDTGDIFIQEGALFVSRPGALYVQYPHETVADFARRNAVEVDPLVRRLNAEVEYPQPPYLAGSHPPEIAAALIGYTTSFEPVDHAIESQPVVALQASRGPE